jgi:predicted RNase H-like HicB family nuclease
MARRCRCTDALPVAGAMIEVVFVVDEAPEGGFTARAVGESVFTEADTLDELRANIRAAVECHFEGGQAPKVIRLHIVRDEILAP